MNKETRTAWTVAAILGIIVILLLGSMANAWYQKQNDIGYVMEEGNRQLGGQREVIRERCNGPLGVHSTECQETLGELSAILTEFSEDFKRAQNATSSNTEIMP